MRKLDFNNNGQLDFSEFMIAHLDPMKVIEDDTLREIFNMFDSDQSGSITSDELKKILGEGLKIGEVDDNEWDMMIDEVDQNGEGEISYSDFKNMMKKLFSIQK